jgi:hypothetical protein
MSRQVDYARANATMLRQLQTLEKASIDAKIRELQGFLALRPHDRALARSLQEVQQLRARETTIDLMLAHAERHLDAQEDQGSQAAVNALLEMAQQTEHEYQRELAELHKPDEAATDPAEECVVCHHSKRAVICLPCGHLAACRQCWQEWKRRKSPSCCLCRAAVTHTIIATQDQRDAAAASPDRQARHGGSVNGAVPPGMLYMSAHMHAPLAAMQLCLAHL